VRRSASEGTGAVATKILIGIAVAVYLLQIAQAGNGNGRGGWIWNNGYLVGAAVADGEWWRLVTAGFLHASPIHLLFNMLMLWWFGTALESLLGRVRFVGIYVVSTLAGSAGALLLTQPNEITVGASGAVFGILGAGLILERRQIMVFGGGAMAVVLFNLLLSFLIPGISIGGHLGGLAGGMVSVLALSDFGRGHAVYGRIGVVSLLGLAGTGIASILVAYLRVRGYS
jgi:membrane associated rhomboid family serine protease